MPTYAYACTECDHRFDVVQSFQDDALTECPACSGRLRKVFTSVGVVFKGSGFYKTDSRASASPGTKAADAKGADAKAAESSGSSSSESSGSSGAASTSGGGSSESAPSSTSSSTPSSGSGVSSTATG